MTLIDTINYLIREQEGELQCLEWDIKEKTNHEVNDNVLVNLQMCS